MKTSLVFFWGLLGGFYLYQWCKWILILECPFHYYSMKTTQINYNGCVSFCYQDECKYE